MIWNRHGSTAIPRPEAEFLAVIESFPHCYSQSPLLTILAPPPLLEQKVVLNWFVMQTLYTETKSENFEEYAQKPQRKKIVWS
jgi:hypothetical protein